MNTTATVRRLLTPAFVLAATLFAGTASAEDPVNVAQIGMTGYATLGAAFDALRDGDTVTLLQDYVPTIDENLMITNQDITFDLDGHYLNLSNACFLTEREARFFGVDAGANAVFTNG